MQSCLPAESLKQGPGSERSEQPRPSHLTRQALRSPESLCDHILNIYITYPEQRLQQVGLIL